MDYRDLIELLREWDERCISDLCGKDILNCDDLCINRGAECIVHQAIAAIETLLAERDSMIVERNAAVDEMRGICKYCKHSPPSYRKTACYDCCDDCHNWLWRGPQKENGDDKA